jgi:hypothetical protein
MEPIINAVWNDLVTSKWDSIFTSFYNHRAKQRQRILDWIVAISSSSSVAAWWIWELTTWVPPTLILVGQLLIMSKPYLFGNAEIRKTMQWDFESRYFEIDSLWLQITAGKLSCDEINNKFQRIRERYFHKAEKYQDIKLESKNVQQKAEIEWNRFLENKYDISK